MNELITGLIVATAAAALYSLPTAASESTEKLRDTRKCERIEEQFVKMPIARQSYGTDVYVAHTLAGQEQVVFLKLKNISTPRYINHPDADTKFVGFCATAEGVWEAHLYTHGAGREL